MAGPPIHSVSIYLYARFTILPQIACCCRSNSGGKEDRVTRPLLLVLLRGYMPRGPNVVISLYIVSNAKQDLSYFCMWACCTFLKRLARLAGHLANA